MVWKDYSPSHFSGGTGTFNGIDESLKEVPSRVKCEPASVGEFWCAHAPSPSEMLESARIPWLLWAWCDMRPVSAQLHATGLFPTRHAAGCGARANPAPALPAGLSLS